uniref:Uncharacterized protein MANES_S087000 n=1 Tax=Rhizophora mucronata TaxID=61149 RepID=A0A2P2N7I5_RHIMU
MAFSASVSHFSTVGWISSPLLSASATEFPKLALVALRFSTCFLSSVTFLAQRKA